MKYVLTLVCTLLTFCGFADVIYHLQGNMSQRSYVDHVATWASPVVYDATQSFDFNDYVVTNDFPKTWVHEGNLLVGLANRQLLNGTNHYHKSGWSFVSCRMGTSAYQRQGLYIPPRYPDSVPTYPIIASNLCVNFRNDSYAYVLSPVYTNGIGNLQFDTLNNLAWVSSVGDLFSLTVSISKDGGTTWEVLDTIVLQYTTQGDFYHYSRNINTTLPTQIRISRPKTDGTGSKDTNFVVVDNLSLTYSTTPN